ncbi:hypothetical protein L596_012871 [Steinernema carpocapsae]|uniref:Transmembrane protein n=1 Tax=Steinernema carpocapsae TaxID=34508 RepID=A0A4U5NZC4_STECR|nr:hypothetical protein L596_012871 [Steinernema carpocapsae]
MFLEEGESKENGLGRSTVEFTQCESEKNEKRYALVSIKTVLLSVKIILLAVLIKTLRRKEYCSNRGSE